MGLVVEADETPHNIDFEVRRESVRFNIEILMDGVTLHYFEIGKSDLLKIKRLLNDPKWSKRLTKDT